ATLRTDTVFLPFHFPGHGRANLLTGTALDPRSRMPEFKVSAVRVEPVEVREAGVPEPEPEPAVRGAAG
ncbi:molybdopterin dinucleotide binding domain-containing protein, partial [Streptomyces phytophilus]|uniref:molybdopterin dinucleotide binding domain-containing protein n=1 Tax=Streptomyces phytophilus TaxID=722715 RepID=UPI0015F0C7CE